MDAKKLLKKHLDIHIPKGEYISEKQLIQLRYDASIDAINEAINHTHCCKSDSELLCKCTTKILPDGNIQLRLCKKCAKEEGFA